MFSYDNYPILFERPRISRPYGWVGHIPFAGFIIDILRPKILVELGTDSGNSYLAFCNAIQKTKSGTKATAVDSWIGDDHAGFYSDSTYQMLSAYHNPRYADFSKLLRSYFDDAVGQFEDGSIDLLHIDGLHTYEAVKHDFQTWLPKLSNSAVVLFHDSQVVGRGFGVRQFVDELAGTYRSFDFTHSNGLTVMQVGERLPESFRSFMEHTIADPGKVRVFFESIAGLIFDEESGVPASANLTKHVIECKIYLGEDAFKYEETNTLSLKAEVELGPWDYSFRFPPDVRPKSIRIDPADVPGVFGVRKVSISSGGDTFELNASSPELLRVNGDSLPATPDAWLRFNNFDGDPYIEVNLENVLVDSGGMGDAILEVSFDYEALVTDPVVLQRLSSLKNEILSDWQDQMKSQWGYAHAQSQLYRFERLIMANSTSQSGCAEDCINRLEVVQKTTDDLMAELGKTTAAQIRHDNILASFDEKIEQLRSGLNEQHYAMSNKIEAFAKYAEEDKRSAAAFVSKGLSDFRQSLDLTVRDSIHVSGAKLDSMVNALKQLIEAQDRLGTQLRDIQQSKLSNRIRRWIVK